MKQCKHCDGWRSFRSANDGSSAIEFGFIAPVLLVVVVTAVDVGTIAVGGSAMQTATRAAIQYAINGGTDMSVAQTQGLYAWSNKPSDATLTATQTCQCSGASHSCTTLCTDGTSPQMYITVSASGTLGGMVIRQSESRTETVRVK